MRLWDRLRGVEAAERGSEGGRTGPGGAGGRSALRRFFFGGPPAAVQGQASLEDVLDAVQQLRGEVRRIGAAAVRAETRVETLGERLEGLGADLGGALARLARQTAELAAEQTRGGSEHARLLLPFLDLGDTLARAARALAEPAPTDGGEAQAALQQERAAFVDVLQRIGGQLERILRAAGVEAIAQEGMPFDPRLHRAVGRLTRPALAGRVVLVDRQGYRLDGALLRPAEVWVAVGLEAAPPDPDPDAGDQPAGAEAAGPAGMGK